ncbi:MAG: beta-propeller domain-containing protein [Nanoarchaeota archaeon]
MKWILTLTGILAVVVLIVIAGVIIQNPEPVIGDSYSDKLKSFSSYQEIENFINKTANDNYYGFGFVGERAFAAGLESDAPAASDSFAGSSKSSQSADSYSTTNIQIQGVDEPDIVKNDGKYIYAVSGTKVVIVGAFPAEDMEILSEININKSINDIFLNDDKLIVFSSEYVQNRIVCKRAPCPSDGGTFTTIRVYGVLDVENPKLEREVVTEGSYTDARMIDDYVYVISTKYIGRENIGIPKLQIDGVQKVIAPSDIAYFDYPDRSYIYSSIMALNLDNGKVENKIYLTGGSGSIFVSEDNIYLTNQKYYSYESYYEDLIDDVFLEVLPKSEADKVQDIMESDIQSYKKYEKVGRIVQDYSDSLLSDEKEEFDKELMEKMGEFEIKVSKERTKTIIRRIEIDEMDIDYKAVGEVPGYVLNQFSMDEYGGNLRIATTTSGWGGNSLNHLYVLNDDLEIIGSVEDLAQGERIYSARFMEERAYMVTFRQVDPLYVIDLSNPRNPEVLGYLKVTGFSNYLHPYDENHIIGIGKEANEEGRVQGLKIALFDVSDVENPKEVAKYEVDKKWSDSNALYDHKAFLFDREKELLVIPISYSEETGKEENQFGRVYPIYRYWQGAYVFNIDLDGIELRGKIDHKENESGQGYYYSESAVQRSLYMDDVLYTISRRFIKANDLDDLQEINEVELPYGEERYYAYPVMGGISEVAID